MSAVPAGASAVPVALSSHHAHGSGPAPVAQAVPVTVATVKSQDAVAWNEFSGRLEAVERSYPDGKIEQFVVADAID